MEEVNDHRYCRVWLTAPSFELRNPAFLVHERSRRAENAPNVTLRQAQGITLGQFRNSELLEDGKILFVASEERYSWIKMDDSALAD